MTPEPVKSIATRTLTWTGTLTRARKIFSGIPILGPLATCSRKNHKDSVKEFAITILFGTATFWVTAVFLKAFTANDGKDYGEVLYTTVSTGQLFIFSVGMLGPILLASAEDPDPKKQFPGRTYHFALILLLGALASGFYAFVLAGRQPQAAGLLNSNFLYNASVCIAVVVVLMRYLTTVYRKSTSSFDAEDGLKAPVNEFAERFNNRHPGAPPDPVESDAHEAADDMVARLNNRKGSKE